jgi:hypothetical protein
MDTHKPASELPGSTADAVISLIKAMATMIKHDAKTPKQ